MHHKSKREICYAYGAIAAKSCQEGEPEIPKPRIKHEMHWRPQVAARRRKETVPTSEIQKYCGCVNIAVAAIFYEEWKWTLLWKLLLLLMSPKLQPRIPLQEQCHERTVATEVVQLSLNSLTVMPNCSLAFCYVIMQPSTPRLPRTRLQTTSAHAIPT